MVATGVGLVPFRFLVVSAIKGPVVLHSEEGSLTRPVTFAVSHNLVTDSTHVYIVRGIIQSASVA